MVNQHQDSIAGNYHILGVIAMEEKYQENVGSTIDNIKKSGIKFVMMTNENSKNSINQGYRSKFISEYSKIHVVDKMTEFDILEQIQHRMALMKS